MNGSLPYIAAQVKYYFQSSQNLHIIEPPLPYCNYILHPPYEGCQVLFSKNMEKTLFKNIERERVQSYPQFVNNSYFLHKSYPQVINKLLTIELLNYKNDL